MSGSSNVAAMKKVVQQLRLEASVTRVKVSAEPRRDRTGRTRRHFTPRGRARRAGAGPGPPAPTCPSPRTRLGGGARAFRGFSRGPVGVPPPRSPDRQRGRSTATPARGSAARSLPPLGPGAAPRPKRSPGRWTRPALPVRALGAGSALPSGSAEGPPQQAGLAPARQDGDVAARHTKCIELVPRRGETAPGTAEKPGKLQTPSVSGRCSFLKLRLFYFMSSGLRQRKVRQRIFHCLVFRKVQHAKTPIVFIRVLRTPLSYHKDGFPREPEIRVQSSRTC